MGILQNHEDTIKKTTGNNVVMVNYIDMLAKHTTERGMEIQQIAQVINQQAMTQQQFGIEQQVIAGAVGKLIEKQKEMEERKGNVKVDEEDQDFERSPGQRVWIQRIGPQNQMILEAPGMN